MTKPTRPAAQNAKRKSPNGRAHTLTWNDESVALGDLILWPDNPRHSTKEQAQRILRSFEKHGQVYPIAIGPRQRDGRSDVYDGHQRISALLTMHGPRHMIDARRSSRALTDAERRSLVLAINGGATGSWNWDALANWDADLLRDEGFDAAMLSEMQAAASALRALVVSEAVEFKEYDESIADGVSVCKCPVCGHEHAKKD